MPGSARGRPRSFMRCRWSRPAPSPWESRSASQAVRERCRLKMPSRPFTKRTGWIGSYGWRCSGNRRPSSPLRRTMQADFFKRDLDRLRQDPLLSGQPHDALVEIARSGPAHRLPGAPPWASFKISLMRPANWSPIRCRKAGTRGWERRSLPPGGKSPCCAAGTGQTAGSPIWRFKRARRPAIPTRPSICWRCCCSRGSKAASGPGLATIEQWLLSRHPFWASEKKPPVGVVSKFLLGLAYPLRLLLATKDPAGDWLVRLSTVGRWVLGLGDAADEFALLSANAAGAAEPGDSRLSPGIEPGADRTAEPVRDLEGPECRVYAADRAGQRLSGPANGRDVCQPGANARTPQHEGGAPAR